MKISNALTWFVVLIAILAFFAAGVGLFYQLTLRTKLNGLQFA